MPVLDRIRREIGAKVSAIRSERIADAEAQKILNQKVAAIERQEREKQAITLAKARIKAETSSKLKLLSTSSSVQSNRLQDAIIGTSFGQGSKGKRFNPISGKFE